MRIAINTNSLKALPLDAALAHIQVSGVRCVEVTTDSKVHAYECMTPNTVINMPFPWDYGLKCVCMSGGWCDFARADMDALPIQIVLAKYMGTDKIRLFLSNPHVEAHPSAKNIDTAVLSLGTAADIYPTTYLLIENHGGITATASMLYEVLLKIAKPNVGTVFDPVNYMMSGQDPVEAISTLSGWIKHVHVKDIKDDELCAVGEGTAPWKEILEELAAIGYDGCLSVEHEGAGDPIKGMLMSITTLERLLYG